MIGDFQDYLRRAEEMLADPERTDPARLAMTAVPIDGGKTYELYFDDVDVEVP